MNNLTQGNVTTTGQSELHEANSITRLLDETMLFDSSSMKDTDAFIAKPGLALSMVIHLLVSKGVLTLEDVQRFLNVRKDK